VCSVLPLRASRDTRSVRAVASTLVAAARESARLDGRCVRERVGCSHRAVGLIRWAHEPRVRACERAARMRGLRGTVSALSLIRLMPRAPRTCGPIAATRDGDGHFIMPPAQWRHGRVRHGRVRPAGWGARCRARGHSNRPPCTPRRIPWPRPTDGSDGVFISMAREFGMRVPVLLAMASVLFMLAAPTEGFYPRFSPLLFRAPGSPLQVSVPGACSCCAVRINTRVPSRTALGRPHKCSTLHTLLPPAMPRPRNPQTVRSEA